MVDDFNDSVLIQKLSALGSTEAEVLKNRLFSYGTDMQPKAKIFLQGEDRAVYGSLLKDPSKYGESDGGIIQSETAIMSWTEIEVWPKLFIYSTRGGSYARESNT